MARAYSLEEYDKRLRAQRAADAARRGEVPGLDDDEMTDEEWEASARREPERDDEEEETGGSDHDSHARPAPSQQQGGARASKPGPKRYSGDRLERAARSSGRGAKALATGRWGGVSPAGLLLGFVLWAAALNLLRGGPAQLRGWLAAKFLNKVYKAPAPAKAKGTLA